MMQGVTQRWQNRVHEWIVQRHKAANIHTLDQKRMYILPSAFGWLFAFALFGVFVGAINYQISSLFLLTFVLAVCAMGGAWQAHKNLQGLRIASLIVNDSASGDSPLLKLDCDPGKFARFDLEFGWCAAPQIHKEDYLDAPRVIALQVPPRERGIHQLPRLYLQTRFPFGLFTVWTWITFSQKYAVYPAPHDPGYWPSTRDSKDESWDQLMEEDELFELRQVEHPWSHPSRIAWKIAARQDEWFVKILQGKQGIQAVFRLEDVPGSDLEWRLGVLSHWIIQAEAEGMAYALQLDNEPVNLHSGAAHLSACLWKLAAYC